MVTMNTRELIGMPLRYAVAIAEGYAGPPLGSLHWGISLLDGNEMCLWTDEIGCYDPTEDWEICGPLIPKYNIWLSPPVGNTDPEDNDGWDAEIYTEDGQEDPAAHIIGCATAQIAICRAVVGLVLGDTVEIPEELVT